MEFKDILNKHLSLYVSSGASVIDRLSFLVNLFQDLKKNGLDLDDYKESVFNILKSVKFTNIALDTVYETCLLRDISKASDLTASIQVIKAEVPENTEPVDPDEQQPDDVPEFDREAVKNRKADYDKEFLKTVGWVE
jgi:hypothetical protein